MRHGFLLIDKPEGPTSHDIVAMVRKALPEKKVGHIGTLDPLASGLLVLGVGAKALKVIELFSGLSKEYLADVTFGSVSATYDREGPIEEFDRKPGVDDPTDSMVLEAIRTRFLGVVQQIPPAASAIHIEGERAYQRMRQGGTFDIPARAVQIDACDIVSYAYPNLTIRVECSSGTYIRSLAHDLGQELRIGGYLSGLRRTKVGEWSIDNAVSVDDVKWTDVIPLKEILKDHPRLDLTEEEFTDIKHGKIIDQLFVEGSIAWCNDLPVALLEKKDGGVKARKVL